MIPIFSLHHFSSYIKRKRFHLYRYHLTDYKKHQSYFDSEGLFIYFLWRERKLKRKVHFVSNLNLRFCQTFLVLLRYWVQFCSAIIHMQRVLTVNLRGKILWRCLIAIKTCVYMPLILRKFDLRLHPNSLPKIKQLDKDSVLKTTSVQFSSVLWPRVIHQGQCECRCCPSMAEPLGVLF